MVVVHKQYCKQSCRTASTAQVTPVGVTLTFHVRADSK
jgi:hypothetical protein